MLSFLFNHWALVCGVLAALAVLAGACVFLGPAVLLKRWKWIVAATFGVGMFALGSHMGESRIAAQWEAEKAKTAITVAHVETKQSTVSAKVEASTLASQSAVHQKAIIIYKKVPVYVTKVDDSRCIINNGFVRVWNAANSGLSLPDAPGVTDGQASGVSLSDVDRQHDREVEYAHGLEVTIAGWQEWAASEAAAK